MIKNLYISTTFLKNGQSVYKAIKLLNKNNIFNIEIGSNHKFEKNLSYFNKFIRNNNFLLHNYFPVPKKGLVINIASYNTEIRQKSIKQIYKSIDFAKSSSKSFPNDEAIGNITEISTLFSIINRFLIFLIEVQN